VELMREEVGKLVCIMHRRVTYTDWLVKLAPSTEINRRGSTGLAVGN